MNWGDVAPIINSFLLAVVIISLLRNGQRMDIIHTLINSRLNELMSKTEGMSRAEGRAEGVQEERGRGAVGKEIARVAGKAEGKAEEAKEEKQRNL